MARTRPRGIKQPHPLGSVRSRSGVSLLTAESGITTSLGVKISALPAAGAANDTDQFEVNQGGVSKRLTLDQVRGLGDAGSETSILDYGAVGDGSTNNDAAFTAAIAAAVAAGAGATVIVPAAPSAFIINSTVVIPQGVNLRVDGTISPGAAMTDLVKVTANINSEISGTGALANASSFATNGVTFDPVAAGNNRNILRGLYIFGFVNNMRIVDGDWIRIIDVMSQNATGNTLYATSGIGSHIEGLDVLGDANGIYYSGTPIEGIIISNCQIMTVAPDAYAIRIADGAGLALHISDTVVQGSVIIDGSTGPTAGININTLYVTLVGGTSATTVGVDIIGSVADVFIDGLTCSVCPKAGLRIRDAGGSGPQRVFIGGYRGVSNGTAAGSADLLIDSASGVGPVMVSNSAFESTGGSVASVLETGAGAVISSYDNNNIYFSTPTFKNANTVAVSGGIPYVNASGLTSYSAVLGATNLLIGGGAGAAPSSVANMAWNNGAGNLEIAGGVQSFRTSGNVFTATSLGTSAGFVNIAGTGNNTFFGTDGSAGGTVTGSVAYATLLGGTSGETQIMTGLTVRATFSSLGLSLPGAGLAFGTLPAGAGLGGDGGNVAVRGYATGGIYFQSAGGATTYGSVNSSLWDIAVPLTGTTATFSGNVTALNATAVGAGANTQAFVKASSTANLGIYYGTGDPTFSAAKGSLYSKTDATTTTTRLWVNTNGSTTWTNFTSSA